MELPIPFAGSRGAKSSTLNLLQVREEGVRQKVCLGIQRSDYMLHDSEEDAALHPRQVEINTISSTLNPKP